LTFESSWGTGQFTVQSSEATNNNYNGTTKVLTIEPDLPSAPANGDSFTILKQIAVPTTKIATIQYQNRCRLDKITAG